MLERDGDWMRYTALFDSDFGSGLKKVGKNVKIHCMAIIPHPETVSIGDNVRIDAFTILSAKEIVIGSHVHIGAHCVLSGRGRIEFQDFSAMSHGARIFTSTDDLSVPALVNTTVPDELQALITGDVCIEKHAIIGTGAVLMPGVTLGMGSVAGAMSYVKDSVRPYSIVGGVPAKFIRERVRHISAEALSELERQCCQSSDLASRS